MEIKNFIFNERKATIIIPDNFNGNWIWKVEFFKAFDKAEEDLLKSGYARVYYEVSDMYGNDKSVRLMHAFHLHVTKEYGFNKKAILFGFSRGGLYALNYSLFYPEYVEKVYLDAPVLDIRTWPPIGIFERYEMLKELNLDETTLLNYSENPINKIKEYFELNIPTLLVAGEKDSVVPYYRNAYQIIKYCKDRNIALTYYTKPECDHHPHSLENTVPIIEFVTGN